MIEQAVDGNDLLDLFLRLSVVRGQ